MNAKSIANFAAPVFLLLGIGTMLAKYVPGFSVPGSPMEWFVAAAACAIYAGNLK
jgi:hypothetical protein